MKVKKSTKIMQKFFKKDSWRGIQYDEKNHFNDSELVFEYNMPAEELHDDPMVVQQPVMVSQSVDATPVTQVQNVWVEGRYVDQVQSNGSVVRVWIPGHYEQRAVVVQ